MSVLVVNEVAAGSTSASSLVGPAATAVRAGVPSGDCRAWVLGRSSGAAVEYEIHLLVAKKRAAALAGALISGFGVEAVRQTVPADFDLPLASGFRVAPVACAPG